MSLKTLNAANKNVLLSNTYDVIQLMDCYCYSHFTNSNLYNFQVFFLPLVYPFLVLMHHLLLTSSFYRLSKKIRNVLWQLH